MNFGGIKHNSFSHTWSAPISLKIKIFLRLVQQNKILTKDILERKVEMGTTNVHFVMRKNPLITYLLLVQLHILFGLGYHITIILALLVYS